MTEQTTLDAHAVRPRGGLLGAPALALVSVAWAFSFSVIETWLKTTDASFIALARLALAAIVFAVGARVFGGSRTNASQRALLCALGGVQFGAMYVLYIRSYGYLAGHEVALFTVLTPVHVVLIDGLLTRRSSRRWNGRAWLAALVAVAGAAVLKWRAPGDDVLTGFLLVQAANLCFALGQVGYRRFEARVGDVAHVAAHAWMYLGATVVAGVVSALTTDYAQLALGREQVVSLVYLALVPSALGFFLWNVAATRVSVGQLAAFNNLKVPLAIVVAIVLFGRRPEPVSFAAGSTLVVLALVLGTRERRQVRAE